MRKPYTIIIAAGILAILVYLLVPRPQVVDVTEVVRGDLNAVLSTTGVVESELADVAPRIVSRIDRLLVQEGQMVRRGQPLALLDRSELLAQVEEARAALSAARQDLARARQAVELQSNQSSAAISHAEAALRASEAQLADLQKGARTQEIEQAGSAVNQAKSETIQARSDLERAEMLHKRGAIPAQQLDAARTAADVARSRLRAAEEQLDLLREGPRPDAVNAAKAHVAAAKAGLAEARTSRDMVRIRKREAEIAASQVRRAEAAVRAAEAQLGYAVVRSPFAGLVATKHLEKGEVAGPQSPIFTLANLGHIWVSAEVDEEDVGAVGVGQVVKITTDAYPSKIAHGRVVRVSPIAEPKAVGRVRAKIVRAKVEIAQSDLPLKPGMEVDVNGEMPVGRDLVLVRNDALVQVGDRYQVFIVRGRKVYPRFVAAGLSNYDYTAIEAGLKPGNLVAVSMLEQLKRGQVVRTRRQESASP